MRVKELRLPPQVRGRDAHSYSGGDESLFCEQIANSVNPVNPVNPVNLVNQ